MNNSTTVIIGGGLSGWMMARRLRSEFPDMNVVVINKGKGEGAAKHPFHLHRAITDVPALRNLKPALMKTGVWDGSRCKAHPSIEDINVYSLKTMHRPQITNIYNCKDFTIYPITMSDAIAAFREVCDSASIDGADSSIETYSGTVEQIRDGIVYAHDNYAHSPLTISYDYLISTISLGDLLTLVGVRTDMTFKTTPFWTQHCELEHLSDMYQMCYNSDPKANITRVTLLDKDIFFEAMTDQVTEGDEAFMKSVYPFYPLENFAQRDKWKLLQPGRLQLVPQSQRKPLLYWLTATKNIMCLGRYGAWTYKVANDVWEDTALLCGIIHTKEQIRKSGLKA